MQKLAITRCVRFPISLQSFTDAGLTFTLVGKLRKVLRDLVQCFAFTLGNGVCVVIRELMPQVIDDMAIVGMVTIPIGHSANRTLKRIRGKVDGDVQRPPTPQEPRNPRGAGFWKPARWAGLISSPKSPSVNGGYELCTRLGQTVFTPPP